MHATRALERYVSMFEVIDNNQIIFTKGKEGGGERKDVKSQTEKLPLLAIFSPQLISVPSFCYSH